MFGGTNPFNKPVAQAAPSTSLFGSPAGAGAAGSNSLFGARPATGAVQPTVQLSTGGGAGGGTGLFSASGGFGSPSAPGGIVSGGVGVGVGIGIGGMPKFNPPVSTESSAQTKGGAQQTVNTKHMVITAMKEYINHSLEEVRMEDYSAGRRGPQPGVVGGVGSMFGGFGTGAVNNSTAGTSSLFGAAGTGGVTGASGTATSSLFGSPMAKPPTFGFNVPSGVGAPSVGVGQATTGLFGASVAGASTAAKPTGFVFGTAAGQSVPGTAGGTTSLFGGGAAPAVSGTPVPGTGLFGGASAVGGAGAKPASPFTFGATGVAASGVAGAVTSQPQSAFGFPAAPAGTSLAGIGGATGGGLFGASGATAAKPFAFPSAAASVPAVTGASFFGTAPSAVNSAPAATGGLFGATAGGGMTGFGATPAKPLFGAITQPATGLSGFGGTMGMNPVAPATGATTGWGGFGGAGAGTSLLQTSAASSAAPGGLGGLGGGGLLSLGGAAASGFQQPGQQTTGFGLGLQQPLQQQQQTSFLQQPFQFQQQQQQQQQLSIGLSANPDEALVQQARVQQQVLELVQAMPYGTAHLSRQSQHVAQAHTQPYPQQSSLPLSSMGQIPFSVGSFAAGSAGASPAASGVTYQHHLSHLQHRPAVGSRHQQQQQLQLLLPAPAAAQAAVSIPHRKQLFESFETVGSGASASSTAFGAATAANDPASNADGLFFVHKTNWKKLTLPSSALRASLDSSTGSGKAAAAAAAEHVGGGSGINNNNNNNNNTNITNKTSLSDKSCDKSAAVNAGVTPGRLYHAAAQQQPDSSTTI